MLDSIEIRNFKAVQDRPYQDDGNPPADKIAENPEAATADRPYYKKDNTWFEAKPLKLKGLTNVNYLVGPNGCGKSSVLEGVTKYLSEPTQYHGSKNSFFREVSHRFEFKENKIYNRVDSFKYLGLKPESVRNSNEVVHHSYFYFVLDSESVAKHFKPDKTYWDGSSEKPDKTGYNVTFNYSSFFIKEIFEYGFNKNIAEGLITFFNNNYFSSKILKQIELLPANPVGDSEVPYVNLVFENESIPLNKEASGVIQLFKFMYCFLLRIEKYKGDIEREIKRLKIKDRSEKQVTCVFFVEEPEHGLHPHLQKKLPAIFDSISKKYDFNIQFLISTHSPFIISAAANEDGQKVYLIEGGQTKDAETEELNTENSKKGYSGGECLFAVNEMLGSQVSSIASTIIFCEKSLSELLNTIKSGCPFKSSIIFTPQSGGGDDTILNSLKNAHKFNYNNLKIFGIVDNENSIKEKIEKINEKQVDYKKPEEQINSLVNEKKAASKIIIINSRELEKLYPPELVNEFLTSKGIAQKWEGGGSFVQFLKKQLGDDYKKQKGKIKNELAEFVGQKVDKEFIKEISEELYNLLYN